MKRYVDENDCASRAGTAARTAAADFLTADDALATVRKVTREAVASYLDRQPTAPQLVSRQRAAEMLGIQSPHVSRLERRGRMPEALPVDGGVPVYIREEVEELAKELEAERAEREAKKEAKV